MIFLMNFRLDKWMLDMTEGPCRMRTKMMRNDLFYIQYPYRPELDSGDNVSHCHIWWSSFYNFLSLIITNQTCINFFKLYLFLEIFEVQSSNKLG